MSSPTTIGELLLRVESETNTIFFTDEDLAIKFAESNSDINWGENNHIISFTRNKFNHLAFGLDDYREFIIVNESVRAIVPLNYKDVFYTGDFMPDKILCEDSTSK